MRGSVSDFSDQLTRDYWQGSTRSWDVAPGETLVYDVAGLDAAGRQLAAWALEAWSEVTDIRFVRRDGDAQITFVDHLSGAYTSTRFTTDGTLIDATVNIAASWVGGEARLGSSAYETYLHEIGHALGLAHAGPYDGTLDPDARLWDNDTTLMSVMSYFDPGYDPAAALGRLYAVTPMQADVAAVQDLYGAAAVRPGDTVWGPGGDLDGPLRLALDAAAGTGSAPLTDRGFMFTLVDTGGTDMIDARGLGTVGIDLRPGTLSTIEGGASGFVIAEGSWIENAAAGDGADTLAGNGLDNTLRGRGGHDTLEGRAGDDTLYGGGQGDVLRGNGGADALDGGAGWDWLYGGDGADVLIGRGGNDMLYGGGQDDTMWGNGGDDTLDGGSRGDVLWGNGGDDLLDGGSGWDRLLGGPGHDTLLGRGGDDVLDGGDHGDVLGGHYGNDTLSGGAGWDRLYGGAGDDALRGGAGDDILEGGAGDDVMWGGAGADLFVFRAVTAGETDRVCDFRDGVDGIRLTEVQDFAALTIEAVTDGIEIRHEGHVLALEGVALGLIDADDFAFG